MRSLEKAARDRIVSRSASVVFRAGRHTCRRARSGENWRLDNTLALVAKINTIFSLKVSNVVRYVNAPVEGFETTDTITSVALVAKF